MVYILILTEALPNPGMRVLHTRANILVTVSSTPIPEALATARAEADSVIMVMERPSRLIPPHQSVKTFEPLPRTARNVPANAEGA
jgi:hypothetical protein